MATLSPSESPAALMRRVRSHAGLTQKQLAAQLGGYPGQIGTWERGEVDPSATNLLRFIAACGFELLLMHAGTHPTVPAPADPPAAARTARASGRAARRRRTPT